MKIFAPLSVLLVVVTLAQSFDETGIGHPGSFSFGFLPQHDIIAMPQQEIGKSQDIPVGEKSRSRGFFSHFRVGRSGNFHIPSASKKATKMTVFPRVGRDSPKLITGDDCDDRHAARDTGSGLWFGPRLGVHKRDDYEMPLSYVLLNGGHGTRMEYIPFQDSDLDTNGDNDRFDFDTLN